MRKIADVQTATVPSIFASPAFYRKPRSDFSAHPWEWRKSHLFDPKARALSGKSEFCLNDWYKIYLSVWDKVLSFMTKKIQKETLQLFNASFQLVMKIRTMWGGKLLPKTGKTQRHHNSSMYLSFKTLRFISSVSKHQKLQGILYYYVSNIHFK